MLIKIILEKSQKVCFSRIVLNNSSVLFMAINLNNISDSIIPDGKCSIYHYERISHQINFSNNSFGCFSYSYFSNHFSEILRITFLETKFSN